MRLAPSRALAIPPLRGVSLTAKFEAVYISLRNRLLNEAAVKMTANVSPPSPIEQVSQRDRRFLTLWEEGSFRSWQLFKEEALKFGDYSGKVTDRASER